MNQRRLLPSTSMLASFESAARLGSFSRAAVELNLTQGAVSRQIRALEDQLGCELFIRTPQKVVLNEAGKQYAKEVGTALNIIRTASLNVITNQDAGGINLAILPTFGTKWLIPRLPDFFAKNPDVTISFASKIEPFDFNEEQIDAAIHYGQPDWPEAECTFLMNETVVPIYAPALEKNYQINSIEDFQHIPLLHLSTRRDHWTKWFHLNGIHFDASSGISFEQFSSIAQAACAGLGVALIPKMFVDNELKEGSLKSFDAGSCGSSSSYYFVTPQNKARLRPIRAFRKWLTTECDGHYIW